MKDWHACQAATLEARIMYIQLYAIANNDWLDVDENLAINYLVSVFELQFRLHMLQISLIEGANCEAI